jgi:hypothetical protein
MMVVKSSYVLDLAETVYFLRYYLSYKTNREQNLGQPPNKFYRVDSLPLRNYVKAIKTVNGYNKILNTMFSNSETK